MSNDLEKFLQQAAERLAQKSNANPNRGNAPQRPAQPSQPRSTPASRPPQSSQRPNRPRPQVARVPEIVEAQIVDDEPIERRRLRELGPDPLSTIDTRPSLAQDISQADERMLSHVHQVFDHELSNMRPASSSLNDAAASAKAAGPAPVSATPMSLVAMLKSPESLRNAFIAGEIFRRKNW